MRSWVKEMYNEHCKPKPVTTFNVIDLTIEQVPTDPDDSIDIHIYFAT